MERCEVPLQVVALVNVLVTITILVVAAAFVAVGCICCIHTNTGLNCAVMLFNYAFQKAVCDPLVRLEALSMREAGNSFTSPRFAVL
jgi:hypothetical protein